MWITFDRETSGAFPPLWSLTDTEGICSLPCEVDIMNNFQTKIRRHQGISDGDPESITPTDPKQGCHVVPCTGGHKDTERGYMRGTCVHQRFTRRVGSPQGERGSSGRHSLPDVWSRPNPEVNKGQGTCLADGTMTWRCFGKVSHRVNQEKSGNYKWIWTEKTHPGNSDAVM